MSNVCNEYMRISIALCFIIPLALILERRLDKKYSKRWIQFFWLLLCIRMVLPIHLQIYLPQQALTIAEKENSIKVNGSESMHESEEKENNNAVSSKIVSDENQQNMKSLNETVDEPKAVSQDENVNRFNLKRLIMYLWGIGIGTYLFIHISTLYYYKKKLVHNRFTIEKNEHKIANSIQKKLHIRKKILIYRSTCIETPMVIGVVRPTIIMPFIKYSTQQFEAVIMHEMVHIKNRDVIKKYLLLVVNAIYWFHPAVYLMIRRIYQNMEFICDEKVVTNKNSEFCRSYSLAILETLKSVNPKRVNIIGNQLLGNGGIKMRFYRIVHPNCTKRNISLAGLLCCVILLAGSIVGCGTSKEEPLNSTSAVQDVTEENQNFLIISEDDHEMADSIFIITKNSTDKKISAISLNRSMNFNEDGDLKTIFSIIYKEHGIAGIADTIESNLSINVDYTAVIQPEQFVNLIDAIGGIELDITEKEADYLNTTNYIKTKKNRTIKDGMQTLNGEQVLGYARVRLCQTSSGTYGDSGRAERQIQVIQAVYKKARALNISNVIDLAKAAVSEKNIETQPELNASDLLELSTELLEGEYKIRMVNTLESSAKYIKEERLNGKYQLIVDSQELKKLFTE